MASWILFADYIIYEYIRSWGPGNYLFLFVLLTNCRILRNHSKLDI